MNERIKKLRKALDLTQQEFANKLNIKRNTVATYEAGKSNPSDAAVVLICKTFNASENWLRTGEGDMFVKRSNEDELASTVERLLTGETSEFKKRLVRVLAGLDEKHWILLEEKLMEIVGARETTPAYTDEDIERKTEDYRRRLILEKNQGDISSPLSEDETEMA